MAAIFSNIEKPTLLIDKEKCLRNISDMATKATKSNIIFRPHFKTHQSHQVGGWFRDAGVRSITVSSVSMARYFAENGWDDILIAFTFNPREIDHINELAKKINLHLLVESKEAVHFIAKQVSSKVGLYLKIDAGYHRTGIPAGNADYIRTIIKSIENQPRLEFQGILSHFGNTYQARGIEEVKKIYSESLERLTKISDELGGVRISVGDTPSCSVLDSFDGVDEIRPGNFVLYDLMQWQIGACKVTDIAVVVACPVVARHENRKEVVLYGGAVHLSKESLILPDGRNIYGMLAGTDQSGWLATAENDVISRMSQEHGILHAKKSFHEHKPGNLAFILPVHSCLSADLLSHQMVF